MTIRRVALLIVLLAAACASGDDDGLVAETTTTLRVQATTTTAAPIETTTSTTPPPRLPAAASSGPVLALTTPTGVVVPVFGGGPGRWVIDSPCGVRTTVAHGTPIHGATVIVDPGHGGVETGAAGANGLVEKDLNLAVANLLKAALEREGATVVLTRTADYRVTLHVRAELAQRLKPPVFVSVHHNGGGDALLSDKPGTETYYQHEYAGSRRLAGLLYEDVLAAFSPYKGIEWHANEDAGAKYRLNDQGGDYYGILRETKGVTAVLLESLYLSASPSEAALLARPDVQTAEAEAVTRAIRRFMLGNDPGSGFVTPIPRTTPAGPGGGAAGCQDPPLR